MEVNVTWCFMDDEAHLVPADAVMPVMDASTLALLPANGDVVVISPRSAWVVLERVFQQMAPQQLLVQVWLGHCPQALVMRKRPPPALVPPESPALPPPG